MSKQTIQNIQGEEIQDSRDKPALRVTVTTEDFKGSFDVPSGASVGLHEAHELRDDDKGMDKAIELLETEVLDALKGMDVTDQEKIDRTMLELDGTPNKKRLGGNTVIGVSVATVRAAAASKRCQPYEHLGSLRDIQSQGKSPRLFINLINGGKHAEGGSPFQEHQVVADTDNLEEALDIGRKVQEKVREYLGGNDITYSIGDEGGFAFAVPDVYEPFKILDTTVEELGLGDKVYLSADIAASSFYKDGVYDAMGECSTSDLVNIYKKLHEEYNLRYIEDPFYEESFEDFGKLRETGLKVIGDDLTTTNVGRIKEAIEKGSIDAVIIKVNQIGTISETLDAISLAVENGVECIVSHRSGETMDPFIADLVRAFNCFGMKSGAWGKEEREVKYKRLVEIYG